MVPATRRWWCRRRATPLVLPVRAARAIPVVLAVVFYSLVALQLCLAGRSVTCVRRSTQVTESVTRLRSMTPIAGGPRSELGRVLFPDLAGVCSVEYRAGC